MKKLLIVALTALILCGCSNNYTKTEETIKEEEQEEVLPMPTKQSDDKHIAYIGNYVGKNCAQVGYTSLGGDRNDHIGNTYIKLIFETNDGSYVDIQNEEELKNYVVVAQGIEQNTECKIGFTLNSKGEEYDNLTNFQSFEEIELQVKKIDEDVTFENKLITPKPAVDRYTYYMPNFVGRNLNTCGYISLGGDLRFRLGEANIKLNIVSSDGSFIELEEDVLKNYVVYAQSVEPNSEFKIQYEVDSAGNEYDNLVDQQSYKEIDIYVKPVNSNK